MWIPTEQDRFSDHVTPEERAQWVWVGDHDCREALSFHIRQMKENGEFITPWVERPFLWLLNYAEERQINDDNRGTLSDEVTDSRILLLPEDVQKAITP